MQLASQVEERLIFEALPLVPAEGLFRLPAPSTGDVFFDLAGDPFVGEMGHEFLFGYAYRDDDGWRYVGQWGLDAEQEKTAFEDFVAFLMERWRRDSELHVYHYAPYEAGAIRRLMGKHAVCEDEVDRILRGGVFVDLYAVVRQAVRASVERYSKGSRTVLPLHARRTSVQRWTALARHSTAAGGSQSSRLVSTVRTDGRSPAGWSRGVGP